MSTFDEREKGYEAKYAHDEEMGFRILSRRNKLLGLWAAERLGKSGEEAEAYAREIVMADLDEPGEEDVFRRVRADLDAAHVAVSDEEIRRRMAELKEVARREVVDEGR